MGTSKLLLPWGGTSVIGHIVQQWRALGANQIAVVCRPADEKLGAELDRMALPGSDRIVNSSAEQGMFSSIQAAAGWNGWLETKSHIAIALGDQPQISSATIAQTQQFAAANPDSIVQPSFAGCPKHPVILPKQRFRELTTTDASTLREFLDAHAAQRKLVEIADPGLNFDLDTRDDYKRALNQFAPNR